LLTALADENSYMASDANFLDMKEKKEEKEISDDEAALIARNYFEGGKHAEVKPTLTALADWMSFTIVSVKKGRKHFAVKCELYKDPSADYKTKYELKISKAGEVQEVSRQ
jgi:hypothetical protein